MEVELMRVDELIEYRYNAKSHPQEQIEQIIKSIEEFGFNDPIAIDENNTVIEGHGRLYALQEMGIQKVPCIRLSHLTEEQKKAYILAHNKLTMNTGWDDETLFHELLALTASDIDMTEFGFEIPSFNEKEVKAFIDDEEVTESHRDATVYQYNLDQYDPRRVEGKYDMPVIEGVDHIPSGLQGFNYVLNKPDKEKGVHFFLDDYQFERVWQKPDMYIEKLTDFDCVLTPDFSLYLDMPVSMQVWNVYRSRLIGQIMQDYGLVVIPTVSWALESSFDFCFDGLPKNATLAISTIGVKKNDEQFEVWKNGVDEMIKRLIPKRIIVYGGQVEYDYGDIEVVYVENTVTERMKQSGKQESYD